MAVTKSYLDCRCSENYAVKLSLMVSNCDFYQEYVKDMKGVSAKSTSIVPYVTWKDYSLILKTFFQIIYRKMIKESYVFVFPFNLGSFFVQSRDLGAVYTRAKREGFFDNLITNFKVSDRIRNNNYIHYRLKAVLNKGYSNLNIYKFTFFLQNQSASKNDSSGAKALRKHIEATVNDPKQHRILKL